MTLSSEQREALGQNSRAGSVRPRPASPKGREAQLDAIERRARRIAGANHSHGAIPARCWRQAIAEAFLGERIKDPEWAEAAVAFPR